MSPKENLLALQFILFLGIIIFQMLVFGNLIGLFVYLLLMVSYSKPLDTKGFVNLKPWSSPLKVALPLYPASCPFRSQPATHPELFSDVLVPTFPPQPPPVSSLIRVNQTEFFLGNLVIVDAKKNNVQIFNSDGEFQFSWGQRGDGPGEFQTPNCACLDLEGNVLITDDNNRIQIFTPNGNLLRFFGAEPVQSDIWYPRSKLSIYLPCGVGVDLRGHIFVAEMGGGRVQEFDQGGTPVRTFGKDTLSDAWGLAVARDGRLVVSDTAFDKIQFFSNGEAQLELRQEGLLQTPYNVMLDREGNIIVIQRISGHVLIFG